FKIPTGSMQPTLYGLHFEDLRNRPDVKVPGPLGRVAAAVLKGDIYHELTAKADGEVVTIRPRRPLLFISRQDIVLRYREGGRTWDETETLWFSPVDGNGGDLARGLVSGVVGWTAPSAFHPLLAGQPFKKGDTLLRMRDSAGDHLFVDRVTYNFRPPRRGEIIVFETEGIAGLQPGQFYIKRLVGLGGERLRLGDDRHLVVDGRRLDATTPHFEGVYSFTGPPADSQFSGHVNGRVGRTARPWASLAPLFPDESAEVFVPPRRLFVMGDNTLNSLDSRVWGDFAEEKVIGRYCFVWWPFTGRWGTRPE
ncbi:MAG TPA: signal peptidase I, partial [Verrucomicrobiota bacterium]|nr:signal peptidase I [Verrucomicrobiota bacterium]